MNQGGGVGMTALVLTLHSNPHANVNLNDMLEPFVKFNQCSSTCRILHMCNFLSVEYGTGGIQLTTPALINFLPVYYWQDSLSIRCYFKVTRVG